MKILFTAFVPFGNISINSSEITLNKLSMPNIYKLLLPVTIDESFKVLDDFLKEHSVDLIIMLGMAAKRKTITIEERAINLLDFNIPDNNGVTINNEKIIKEENDFLYSSLNIEKIVNNLNNKNFNVEKSSDAGKYICNYIYFMTLHKYTDILSMFIHIPLFNDEINEDITLNALNEIIDCIKKLM